MFLFDLLFGKKKVGDDQAPAPAAPAAPVAHPAAAGDSAPGTRIHHDPALIGSLMDDHRKLLAAFQAIAASTTLKDFARVQKLLGEFQTLLTDHLLKENVRLYVYLEHLLQGDPVSHQMMHGFRHEMDDIGRAVIGFLGKYKSISTQPELAVGFPADLQGIGEALVARIKREEDILYPMYSAPGG